MVVVVGAGKLDGNVVGDGDVAELGGGGRSGDGGGGRGKGICHTNISILSVYPDP
jgi:hypothetical protein